MIQTRRKRPSIGQLRERVTVISFTHSVPALGSPREAVVDGESVWAKVVFPRATERVRAGRNEAVVDVRITTRETRTTDEGFRYDGQIYRVTGVVPDERGRFTEHECRRVT